MIIEEPEHGTKPAADTTCESERRDPCDSAGRLDWTTPKNSESLRAAGQHLEGRTDPGPLVLSLVACRGTTFFPEA